MVEEEVLPKREKDEKTYTHDEVLSMLRAYHNYSWALAITQHSPNEALKTQARNDAYCIFGPAYEKTVPREIRDKLHLILTEDLKKSSKSSQ